MQENVCTKATFYYQLIFRFKQNRELKSNIHNADLYGVKKGKKQRSFTIQEKNRERGLVSMLGH